MSAQPQRHIIHPNRTDKPPHPSSQSSNPPSGEHCSLHANQHSKAEQVDDNGHSRDTLRSFTPIPCQHEPCVEVQTQDATTPVMGGNSPLPSPPLSPQTEAVPPSPGDNFSTVLGNRKTLLLDYKPSVVDSTVDNGCRLFNRYDRRPSSQRLADRKRHAQKRNKGNVIGDFNGMYRDELSIKVGEDIEIISKDTIVSRNIGWWTGRNNKGKIGIFPAACVSCDMQGSEKGGGASNSEYPLEIKNSEVQMKEVIGIGGFGKVFRGIYKGEEVAVKVAKTTTYDSLKAVQDVIAEAEKFAHLAHINICALVGVVLVKDVCLVMECAQGGALSEILHKGNSSFPIDVIIDWASQIASGMHYLHHEAEPSLIHRDLKTSNILLAYSMETTGLRDNVIKITDFGLAREIEHTTHMSGAGTYPWMAPEIIRTSHFSKKSDVWSYAVVLWELLTGERPYNGLSFFVVAYGVGHGTLSLPIPDGCPESLVKILKDCWTREHTERPSFVEIVADIKAIMDSEFCSSTSHEEFKSMQTLWKEEIQKKFVELKKMEVELERREVALQQEIMEQKKKKKELDEEKNEMRKKKEEYERLIRQISIKREKEPHKDGEEVDGNVVTTPGVPASPIESLQPQQTTQPPQEVQSPPSNSPPHVLSKQQKNDWRCHQPTLRHDIRPPRVKPFSIRRLIRKLWGNEANAKEVKMGNPLPDRMESVRTMHRFTSSPGLSTEKKRVSLKRHGTPPRIQGSLKMERYGTPPMLLCGSAGSGDWRTFKGHRRNISVELKNADHLIVVPEPETLTRRGSVPTSPLHNRHQYQPVDTNCLLNHNPSLGTKSVPREADKLRQRSWSDLRSSSPQYLLPSHCTYSTVKVKSNSPPSPQLSSYLVPNPISHSPSPHPPAAASSKPAFLGLLGSKNSKGGVCSHDGNSPSSPNVTITPAEQHPLRLLAFQYDSGKDSMTCSDASGHSNCSEIQPNMIKLDSPVHLPSARKRLSSCIDLIAAEFDPLRSSLSHDSLLESACQDKNPTISPTSIQHQHQSLSPPTVAAEGSAPETNFLWNIGTSLPIAGTKLHQKHRKSPVSPKKLDSSPKQSLTTSISSTEFTTDLLSSSMSNNPPSLTPSPSIVRPRPKPSKVLLKTISAPSSRPHSPKLDVTEGLPKWNFKWHSSTSPTGSVKSSKDLNFNTDLGDFYVDSDTTSANSSLIELMMADVDDITVNHISVLNSGFLSQQ